MNPHGILDCLSRTMSCSHLFPWTKKTVEIPGVEPEASHIQRENSTTELYPFTGMRRFFQLYFVASCSTQMSRFISGKFYNIHIRREDTRFCEACEKPCLDSMSIVNPRAPKFFNLAIDCSINTN